MTDNRLKEELDNLMVYSVMQEPMDFAKAFECALDKILVSKVAEHKHDVMEKFLDEGEEHHVKEIQDDKVTDSDYKYRGHDKKTGLHIFKEPDGELELFAKRHNAPSGWHLKRGNYFYEYTRTLGNKEAQR